MRRQHYNEAHLTVRRGFPAIFRAKVNPAEPDVGIFSRYVDDYEVLTTKGKPADFLRLTESEIDTLIEDFFNSVNEERDYE